MQHHREDAGDEFPKGIDVIGVDRHDVAMRPGVEIGQRKRLHVGEKLIADKLLAALADLGDDDLVNVGGDDANPVDPGHNPNGGRQARLGPKDNRRIARKHRGDDLID